MSKSKKNAVVASEVPAIESIEAVVATMETVEAPAKKKKRRHARKNKMTRTNIVHVSKTRTSHEVTEGNVTTKTSILVTVHTILTTIESANAKDFTLQLATFLSTAPQDLKVAEIMYEKVPTAK